MARYSVRPRPAVALTIEGVAEALSIRRDQVEWMIEDGLPVRRLSFSNHRGNRRILVRELEQYIVSNWPVIEEGSPHEQE